MFQKADDSFWILTASDWSKLVEVTVQIWVDADACPAAVKELLFRAADRTKTRVTFVSNQILRTPASPWVASLLVAGGMNVADRRIVEVLSAGDLVVTADIPLAADAVGKEHTSSIREERFIPRRTSASGW